MNTPSYRRFEARVPARSNAGIALFCSATILPVALIALTLLLIG